MHSFISLIHIQRVSVARNKDRFIFIHPIIMIKEKKRIVKFGDMLHKHSSMYVCIYLFLKKTLNGLLALQKNKQTYFSNAF